MGSALEEFRAQREAVLDVQRRLVEVADLLRSLREQTTALAQDQQLRTFLQEEQTWLLRAESVIRTGASARERELQRFWPGVWRRWAVAMAFALATALAVGAGYVWASHPQQAELDRLRPNAELGDAVARRLLRMAPSERRQFDALMRGSVASGK
jgi:hypothetical protein